MSSASNNLTNKLFYIITGTSRSLSELGDPPMTLEKIL
jgi:hypothetical protein